MIKRFKNLSISNALFIMTIFIVGLIMLTSSFITYNMIFRRTNEMIESTSKEINKQVILNYENYLSSVINTSNALQKYILEYTKDNELDALQDTFVTTKNIEKNILTVALFDEQGQLISASSSDQVAPNIIDKDWYIQAIDNVDIHHFSSPHSEDVFNTDNEVFSISKCVQYYNTTGESQNGVLLINIDTSEFKNLGLMTNLGEQGHIVIMNQSNELIYSSKTECNSSNCESVEVVNLIILGGELFTIDDLSMYVSVNTIKYTRWRIATFINVNAISDTKGEILLTMVMIFGGTLIAIALSSAAFSHRITSPMNKLEKHIKDIEGGNFDSRIHVEGQKEVVILAEAFNAMSDHVKELMEKVLVEQNEKRKTQFIALQNQINPHFLYNTLDSIVWLSENHRNKDVEKAIIELSKFFRMSISSEKNVVLLKDEIEHVSSYLSIQQIRYHNAFIFDFEIDPKVVNYHVLKLSLQPLVENAILHGIRPDEEFTKISIKAYEKDGFICIEVINEGYGMTTDRISEIHQVIRGEKESSSMGIKNVYQRLKLYYGASADLYIQSQLDESTTVTMKMPILEGEIL
ncbi:MAG: sensor histidine kinase [Bacillota bacterium]